MTKNTPFCNCTAVHTEAIEQAKATMPPEDVLYDLADFFKVMGDSTRIRILWALEEGEMCVCDLAALLNMTKSAVSHQLKTLKQSKLVKYVRRGKNVFYSLDDDHIKGILSQGLDHISEL